MIALEDFFSAKPEPNKKQPQIEAAPPPAPEDTDLYKAGFEAGQKDAQAQAQRALADALKTAAAAFEAVRADGASARNQAELRAARLTRLTIERLAPKIAAEGFAQEAAAQFEAWARALPADGVRLALNPVYAAQLRAVLAQSAQFGAGALSALEIADDPAVMGPAMRFEWTDGVAEFDLGASAQELVEAIVKALPTPPEPPKPPAAAKQSNPHQKSTAAPAAQQESE